MIFSALEGALVDPRSNSFAGAEEALYELYRRKIALILLTSWTRAEIEPVRRKIEHAHPFVTESGGGIFFPDGYFSVKIPNAVRAGRYLSVALGRPYAEVCEALDEIGEECAVGVTGFHHMSAREIASNTGLRPRDAELAQAREFDEPFYFTSDDDKAIARFGEAARERGYKVRRGDTFWHLSSGCDPARAVRIVTDLFREATHSKLRTVGIGASEEDLQWLRATGRGVLLAPELGQAGEMESAASKRDRTAGVSLSELEGPAGWGRAILDIIG